MKKIILLFAVSFAALYAGKKSEALARKDAREYRKRKHTKKAQSDGWEGCVAGLGLEQSARESLNRHYLDGHPDMAKCMKCIPSKDAREDQLVAFRAQREKMHKDPSCAKICCRVLVGLTTIVAYTTLILAQYDSYASQNIKS